MHIIEPSYEILTIMPEHPLEHIERAGRTAYKPEEARSVLPNSLKTEIVVTANLREWRHIFRLRTSNQAHPQMRQLMRPLLARCRLLIPVLFDDVGELA